MSRNHQSATTKEEEEEENNPKRARSADVADVMLDKAFFLDHLQCVVCIGTLNAPILAVPCAHQFCETCLASWFHTQKNNTCPVCRTKVYMVINAPKVTERLLEVYVERFPPLVNSTAAEETSQESSESEKSKLPVLIKNEPLRRNHRNIFVNATDNDDHDEDDSDDSEESEDSDSDDNDDEAFAATVPMEQILAFMELTGASQGQAHQIISGALARGLTMDHAVEYFFSQAAA